MKHLLLGIVSLALAVSAAQARVGETEEAISLRYGAPVSFGTGGELPQDALGNPSQLYSSPHFAPARRCLRLLAPLDIC